MALLHAQISLVDASIHSDSWMNRFNCRCHTLISSKRYTVACILLQYHVRGIYTAKPLSLSSLEGERRSTVVYQQKISSHLHKMTMRMMRRTMRRKMKTVMMT